jgi:hypothetical protein
MAMNDINNDTPPQLDQLTMNTSPLIAGRNLRPATDSACAGVPPQHAY